MANLELHPHLIKRLEERAWIEFKKHTISFIRDTFMQFKKNKEPKLNKWRYILEDINHKFVYVITDKWYLLLTYIYKNPYRKIKKMIPNEVFEKYRIKYRLVWKK